MSRGNQVLKPPELKQAALGGVTPGLTLSTATCTSAPCRECLTLIRNYHINQPNACPVVATHKSAFAELNLQGAAMVQAASRAEFGDYQANGVMAAAKRARLESSRGCHCSDKPFCRATAPSPKLLAQWMLPVWFINLTLSPHFVAPGLKRIDSDSTEPQVVVVDYSAPNLAKEMHVSHLRTTIIGDCVVRV